MSPYACPKCGAALSADPALLSQCPACGVYFAKLNQPPHRQPPLVYEEVPAREEPQGWRAWLLPAQPPASHQLVGWTLLLAVMLLWGGWFVTRDIRSGEIMESFLHQPNLAFHEAGHVLFIPLGEFMSILGGSLFQCLVPLILTLAFLRRHDAAGAAATLWWTGQNLLDVAPYIADARSLSLPLIGEVSEEMVDARALRHDWHNILLQLDMLEADMLLARLAWLCGTLIMLTGSIWLAAIIWRGHRQAQDS